MVTFKLYLAYIFYKLKCKKLAKIKLKNDCRVLHRQSDLDLLCPTQTLFFPNYKLTNIKFKQI